MGIIINEIKDTYRILLHKVNEEVIGELPFEVLNSISNSMNELGQIEISVNKYYRNQIGKKLKRNIYYDEIKNERLISLDEGKYVIKDIKEDTKLNKKTVTAYSLEKKLEKIAISVEDLGFYLQDSDEGNGIFNLDDYMYEETGWRFGHIDKNVKNNGDGTPKMRWQESVDTSWLDYLKKNITTQFECYVYFDNKNQLINLYDMSSFGENLNLALSYDNYIKSLEKTSSSSDLVTKLILVGNEEECIISDYTPTGTNYIENYSYYMSNNEMSQELITALTKYNEITAERTITWKTLRENKLKYEATLTTKKHEEKNALDNISTLKDSYEFYASKMGTDEDVTGVYTELASETSLKIQEYEGKSNTLYIEIQELELQISAIEESIRNINILCQKKTATDKDGNLIFGADDKLLNELKKFISSETFIDDSYYDAEEMIIVGENRLNILCKPTRTWDINVVDFTSRIISNRFRKQWKGVLGLGDVICLYDNTNDTEEFVYIVGYDKNYKDNSLSITLSDKKESEDLVRYINDWLKIVKSNNKLITTNRRLFNMVKNNRINIKKSEVK